MTLDSTSLLRRRHWSQFGLADLLLAATAFAIGLAVGYVALVGGAHGGSPWPTVFLSAPAFLPAALVCGDTVGYAYAVIGGTALLFAVYASAIRRRGRRALNYVLGFHTLCVVVAALLVFASGP